MSNSSNFKHGGCLNGQFNMFVLLGHPNEPMVYDALVTTAALGFNAQPIHEWIDNIRSLQHGKFAAMSICNPANSNVSYEHRWMLLKYHDDFFAVDAFHWDDLINSPISVKNINIEDHCASLLALEQSNMANFKESYGRFLRVLGYEDSKISCITASHRIAKKGDVVFVHKIYSVDESVMAEARKQILGSC